MRFTPEYIKSEHGVLIDSVTRLYETLRDMRYLYPEELKYPPHENFPTQHLASIGLTPESIAIIRNLPYLDFDFDSDDDRPEISGHTCSFSYLRADDIPEARQVFWEGGNDLAPWVIRLSYHRPVANWGRTILYDIPTKSVAQWDNEQYYISSYVDLLPGLPANEVFDQWIGWLKELKEIPWRQDTEMDHHYHTVRVHPGNHSPCPVSELMIQVECGFPAGFWGHFDPIANGIVDPEDPEVIAEQNRRPKCGSESQAKKNLFIKHGWPDKFRGDDFEEEREEWQGSMRL